MAMLPAAFRSLPLPWLTVLCLAAAAAGAGACACACACADTSASPPAEITALAGEADIVRLELERIP